MRVVLDLLLCLSSVGVGQFSGLASFVGSLLASSGSVSCSVILFVVRNVRWSWSMSSAGRVRAASCCSVCSRICCSRAFSSCSVIVLAVITLSRC